MVSARRLANNGAMVHIWLAKKSGEFSGVPAHQLGILKNLGIATFENDNITELHSPDLIIDGIIGYSLSGSPRSTAAKMIRWANRQNVSILALDVPSGLDATTGIALDPVIKATATMSLALPKVGLKTSSVEDIVGELYLADISVPPSLYARLGVEISTEPIFAESEIIRLH